VRLFSVTVRTTLSEAPSGISASISSVTCTFDPTRPTRCVHRTVVALWSWLWTRPGHRSAAGLRFPDWWRWPLRTRASTAGRSWGRLLQVVSRF
jgi:hypothetical protein